MQSSFFTEIREIIRPEDLPRFDCFVYEITKQKFRNSSSSKENLAEEQKQQEIDQEEEWIRNQNLYQQLSNPAFRVGQVIKSTLFALP